MNMRRKIVSSLIEYLRSTYGEAYIPYGTSDSEEEGTGFRLSNIAATFSVLSFGEVPADVLDYQIESFPPGDYLHTGSATLDEFKHLITKYLKPMKDWPA
jgi:hypothetical protein